MNFRLARFLPMAWSLLVCLNFLSLTVLGQGDGPRTMLLVPKNVVGVDVKWLNLRQNLVPAGNIFIPGSDIKVNVVPVTVFYTFGIGGRFAQVYANFVPGKSDGTVNQEKFGLGK